MIGYNKPKHLLFHFLISLLKFIPSMTIIIIYPLLTYHQLTAY